jgi:hypothetical protein
MCEAFHMHVSSALNAIKKRSTFKAYKEAYKAYVEQREVAKQAKAALALFTALTSKGEKDSKKASGKESLKKSSEKEKASEKEPAKKPSEKEKTSKKTKEAAALANAPAPELCNEYQALYNKAIFVKETAKNKKDAAATKMFQFYANLLSLDAKYVWNKIVQKQTEADPFKDLQGMSRKGPRGLLRESFGKCVMFHLLTVFPNNAAEQEKYYLSNVLKKPQRVGIRWFVQLVKQLNAYVVQLPCWYYSPNYNAGMMPANLPFSKVDLASHVLRMCPHQWQDQYNLQGKGMTPMDMRSFQASLKVIERVCTPKKSHAPSGEKDSHKNEAGAKRPSTGAMKQATKKVGFEKSCKLCKKYGGMHTTHATKDCRKYEKDGMAKANFCTTKKAGKKSNPTKQLFAQLSKKFGQIGEDS